MQPWVIALLLRPLALFALFVTVAFVAYKVIHPLVPDGVLKAVLFDRTLQKKHPWKFFFGFAGAVYGLIALGLVWVNYFR